MKESLQHHLTVTRVVQHASFLPARVIASLPLIGRSRRSIASDHPSPFSLPLPQINFSHLLSYLP